MGTATSHQIEFGSTDQQRRLTTIHRSPEPVVDIRETWRHKGRASPAFTNILSFESTHARIFQDAIQISNGAEKVQAAKPVLNLARTQKLREEDQKGRRFNIINQQYEGHEKWKVPLTQAH